MPAGNRRSSAATRSLVMAPDHANPNTASAVAKPSPRTRRPRGDDPAEPALGARIDLCNRSPWLDRHAQRPHAIRPADADDRRGNHRMELEMPVRIDVIERQSGGAISLELRGDFLRRLPLH